MPESSKARDALLGIRAWEARAQPSISATRAMTPGELSDEAQQLIQAAPRAPRFLVPGNDVPDFVLAEARPFELEPDSARGTWRAGTRTIRRCGSSISPSTFLGACVAGGFADAALISSERVRVALGRAHAAYFKEAFRFVRTNQVNHSVALLCRALEAPQSGYWRARQ